MNPLSLGFTLAAALAAIPAHAGDEFHSPPVEASLEAASRYAAAAARADAFLTLAAQRGDQLVVTPEYFLPVSSLAKAAQG